MWLEGKHCRKDIRWYAEYDREIREDFHLTYPDRVWRHNTDWRQNSINEMNNWRLFVDKIYKKQALQPKLGLSNRK